MGISSSSESTSAGTVKLILEDGQLVEFPYAVKVSYVAQRYPSCFVCNSDAMEFGEIVSAMRSEEELLPGHIYFALPLSRLKYALQPEEMAALAVKASLALAKSSNSVVSRKVQERRRSSSDGNSVGGEMRKKRASNSCKDSRRSFTSNLTVIQE